MNTARFSGTALAVSALVGAATLLTAPTVSAYITAVTPTPGIGLGGASYGTGCTYKVTITGAPGDRVWMEDLVFVNGQYDHNAGPTVFGPVREIEGQPGKFTVDWTPNAIGDHWVSAGHNPATREGASVKVTVTRGINLGSSCIAVP
ncbi:hypothetical protein NDR87_00035 [Nocardia sp. CDC159]|uniref:Ig-like domain-containing protein n=1 Tax=Nocardia pulmonis TaxID=2951408 RepID=A0A9X2E1Q7_9NOCA|nr:MULTISPECIES: hypothetical protein [Nocardia]MCM6772602.1 hypothetical protein [Nocardia pulmonis]MCM6784740.1 hypothetical protein [Nocardia sp. CDC159]